MKINYLRPFNIAGHTLNRNLLIGNKFSITEKIKNLTQKNFILEI